VCVGCGGGEFEGGGPTGEGHKIGKWWNDKNERAGDTWHRRLQQRVTWVVLGSEW